MNGRKRVLFELGVEVCEAQWRMGLGFILEHPVGSRAWKLDVSEKLRELKGVYEMVFDQCDFGLCSVDESGVGLYKKPTRVLTNVKGLEEFLAKRCGGGHRHIHLLDGRAKGAAKYPELLCKAFLTGIAEWVQADE